MTKKVEKFNKYEFKYILNPVEYMMIKDFFEDLGIDKDNNGDKNGEYKVASLYFETFGLEDYYDKSAGILRRKKLRARIYEHDVNDKTININLEIKNKHEMFIFKNRSSITKEDWMKFVNGDFIILPSESSEFFVNLFKEGRMPNVLVRYDREAFFQDFISKTRITFDKNIEAISQGSFGYTNPDWCDIIPVLEGGVVMEIKFSNRMPWWLKFLEKKFNLRRTPYSKYSQAVDAVNIYNALPK